MKLWIVFLCLGTPLILFSAVALIKTYQARKLHEGAVVFLSPPWLAALLFTGVLFDVGAGIMYFKTRMPPITLRGGSFKATTDSGTPNWRRTGDNFNYATTMPLNGSTTEYLTIIAAQRDDGSKPVPMTPIAVQGDWIIEFDYDDGFGGSDHATKLQACTAPDCTLNNSSTTGVIYLKGDNSNIDGTNGEFLPAPLWFNGVWYDVNQCRRNRPNCDRGRRDHFHQLTLTTAGAQPVTYFCPTGTCRVYVDTQYPNPVLSYY